MTPQKKVGQTNLGPPPKHYSTNITTPNKIQTVHETKKSTIHTDINVKLFREIIMEVETQCKQNKLQETKIKEILEKVNKIKTTQKTFLQ